MNNTTHQHGEPKELILTVALTLEQMVLAIQDEATLRNLVQRAMEQGGLAATLHSSGKGTIQFWINCSDGCMKVSLDGNVSHNNNPIKEPNR